MMWGPVLFVLVIALLVLLYGLCRAGNTEADDEWAARAQAAHKAAQAQRKDTHV